LARLIFIPGATAVEHTGYFSKVRDEVANRAEVAKIPTPIIPFPPYTYIVGSPYFPDESLIRGQVYYWTVDETDAQGNTFAGEIWEFTIQGFEAYAPSPPNEAILVDTSVLLSWLPGFGVEEHDVYFGTNFEDVNRALAYYGPYDPDPPPEYMETVSEPNILVTSLEFNTKYYWRVNEISGRMPPPLGGGTWYEGDVWCFTILPGEVQPDFPADGAVITGNTEYSGDVYIWTRLIFIPSATAVEHTGYFSDDYSKVENRDQDANLGSPPYASIPGWEYTFLAGIPQVPPANDTLVRGTTYYWTVDATDALGNTFAGDIWEFTILGFYASEPSPPDEAVDVETTVLLSWRSGFYDNGHAVFLGTSWEDVNNAVYNPTNQPPELLGNVPEPNILVTGLEFNTKYYWRADECAARCPPPLNCCISYKGEVWCFTTEANRIFVDVDAGGANNGASWENACNFLQDALIEADSALKPVEIRVAEGIYTPDSNSADPNGSGSRAATFRLINGVTIKGGYAGYGQPNPDARDIEFYETILSGDLDGNDVDVNDPADLLDEPTRSENSYHVVTGSGTDSNTVLDGFTITAGNANGSLPHHGAGGIAGFYGDIINCTVSGNSAIENGGGMGCHGKIINCVVTWNSAGSMGGGLHRCNAEVYNCIISWNWAGIYGGGMYNQNYPGESGPIIENCTFSNNSAGQRGGGIYNDYSSSPPRLGNCTFIDNSAILGGGMCNYESSPILTNCIFSGNSASQNGGGMFSDTYPCRVKVINCTFSHNSASQYGGATFCGDESEPQLVNSIFWDNTAAEGPQIAVDQAYYDSLSVSYCNIQGGKDDIYGYSSKVEWGNGNIDEDPCFIDVAGGDLRLSSDSPCIDAGDNNAPNLPPTDFDGHPRIIDGDCNDTEVVDMGAYEFNYAYMGDFDYNCRVNFADLSIFGLAWTSQPGDFNWDFACNISIPADNVINKLDLAAFADNWLAGFQ
jgi:hypothetical protein